MYYPSLFQYLASLFPQQFIWAGGFRWCVCGHHHSHNNLCTGWVSDQPDSPQPVRICALRCCWKHCSHVGPQQVHVKRKAVKRQAQQLVISIVHMSVCASLFYKAPISEILCQRCRFPSFHASGGKWLTDWTRQFTLRGSNPFNDAGFKKWMY